MATPASDADDIQAQVFQTTLAEVSSSRPSASTNGDNTAGSPDCCVICLDTITEPCTSLPCAHAHFDFLCLLSWLEERPACPLCKANIYKVRYNNEAGGENIYRVPNATRSRNSPTGPTQDHAVRESVRRRRRASIDAARNTADDLLSRPAEAIERRRYIYRHQLYSLRMSSLCSSDVKVILTLRSLTRRAQM